MKLKPSSYTLTKNRCARPGAPCAMRQRQKNHHDLRCPCSGMHRPKIPIWRTTWKLKHPEFCIAQCRYVLFTFLISNGSSYMQIGVHTSLVTSCRWLGKWLFLQGHFPAADVPVLFVLFLPLWSLASVPWLGNVLWCNPSSLVKPLKSLNLQLLQCSS